jgi:hypothetical protein
LESTAVSSTAAELNLLDGLDRGSILYGNASSATTVLGQGTADQVLTSDGTDIAWADASGGGISGLTGLVENNSIWLGNDPSGTTSTAEYNVALGTTAMESITTGDKNVAIGYDALATATTGVNNTCIGLRAGNLTTSDGNTFIGYDAGRGATTGSGNICIGTTVGDLLGSSGSNVLIGNLVCESGANGNGKLVMIGTFTGRGNGGKASHSVGIGYASLYSAATSEYNQAIGYQCAYYISTGVRNTCIGTNVASGAAGTALTTGTDNILIGTNTDCSAADSTDQIVMGLNVVGNADDSFCFGNGSTDSAIAFGATSITAPSDIRLKEDIEDEVVGLDFINELRPVTFRWKKAKDVPEELSAHVSASEKRIMNGKYNHGFISQEVKEVIDNNPDIKEGFDMWTEDEADGRQRIGESALIPMLVKSIQELTARIEELEGE